jgi:hypothetical protein
LAPVKFVTSPPIAARMIITFISTFSWRSCTVFWWWHEDRRRLNQLDERPERGVTGGDGAMRGGGAGRWEVAV